MTRPVMAGKYPLFGVCVADVGCGGYGVRVTRIREGSPCADASFKVGDVIIGVFDYPIGKIQDWEKICRKVYKRKHELGSVVFEFERELDEGYALYNAWIKQIVLVELGHDASSSSKEYY